MLYSGACRGVSACRSLTGASKGNPRTVPSEKQVRWSQLRVGLTVLFASITLAVLIFVMTGTTGLFTKKIVVHAFVDNAGGLRVGAPVRLEGVDIGNVTGIRVVQDPKRKAAPVDITMKITTKYEDTMKNDCEARSTQPEFWVKFSLISTAARRRAAAETGELPTQMCRSCRT